MSEDYVDPTMMRSSKSENPLSFEYIVHDQIWRIIKLQSVDWHGGLYEERPLIAASGAIIDKVRTYIPSTAEAYFHAVEGLYDLISAHVSKNVHDSFGVYEKEVEELKVNIIDDRFFLLAKAQAARRLFRSMTSWLKTNDYFKGGQSDDSREEQ